MYTNQKFKKMDKNLRIDIRKNIVSNIKKYINIQENISSKFDSFYDIGITEMDMNVIVVNIEEDLGVTLDDDKILESTDIKLFDLLTHYNDVFYEAVVSKKNNVDNYCGL